MLLPVGFRTLTTATAAVAGAAIDGVGFGVAAGAGVLMTASSLTIPVFVT